MSCSTGLRSRPSIGGLGDAQERIRGDQDEQIERAGDPGLHRQHMGAQRQRQIVAEGGDQAAEQRQDRHPQQHRAFVIAPHAGDLVDQRLHRMRILEHVDDGEIRGDVQHHQRRERRRHEQQLRERGGARDIHQGDDRRQRAPSNGTVDWISASAERQHQRVMSGFRDHFDAPCTGAARPRRAGLGAVIVLPVALLLQGVGDILGHVGLVMLCQHGVGPEDAGSIERAFGDDALPFAEQVRQNSLVGDRQRGAAVGDAEIRPRDCRRAPASPAAPGRRGGTACRRDVLLGRHRRRREEHDGIAHARSAPAPRRARAPRANRRSWSNAAACASLAILCPTLWVRIMPHPSSPRFFRPSLSWRKRSVSLATAWRASVSALAALSRSPITI